MKILLLLFLLCVFVLKTFIFYIFFEEIFIYFYRNGFTIDGFFLCFCALCFEGTYVIGFLFFYFKSSNKNIMIVLFVNLCSIIAISLQGAYYTQLFFTYLQIIFLCYLIFLLKREKSRWASTLACPHD